MQTNEESFIAADEVGVAGDSNNNLIPQKWFTLCSYFFSSSLSLQPLLNMTALRSQPPWSNSPVTKSTNLTLSNPLHSPLMLRLFRTRYYSLLTHPTGLVLWWLFLNIFNCDLLLDRWACSVFWLSCSISNKGLVYWQGCFRSQVCVWLWIKFHFFVSFIVMVGLYILVVVLCKRTLRRCKLCLFNLSFVYNITYK